MRATTRCGCGEKQRLRAQYGSREQQLRRALAEARRRPEQSGDGLFQLLELRLDAVVLRAGFARSIAQARQSVVHRHVLVDGERVDKPSYRLRPGQLVSVAPRSAALVPFQAAAAAGHAGVLPVVPPYLDARLADLAVRVVRLPFRDEVPITCDVSKVVEFYAR